MKNVLTFLMLTLFLAGCFGVKPFQPPPDSYEHWRGGPHADKILVWKDMLECGYQEPFGRGEEYRKFRDIKTFDETVAAMICMENLGYSYINERKVSRVCDAIKGAIACQPGAVIPSPDKNRRLDSPYCQVYPKSEACHP